MRSLALLIALAVVAPASRAHAQLATPADQVAKARAAFERGAKLASEERWGDALRAFSESAELRPHATTTYNVGYCERALGHAVRARKNFALAITQDEAAGGTELTPELRAASKKYLDEVRSQIATPKLIVPKGVAITIDGRPLEKSDNGRFLGGTRPPGPGEPAPSATLLVEVDAGAHEIVISAPDGRSKVAHEYFSPGSTKDVHMELPPPPSAPAPVIVDDNKSRRTWGYVIGGIGIVGMGIGTYFGLSARSSWSNAKDECPSRTACSDDAVRMSIDARTEANVSTIAFVAGGAALLGGTILVLSSSPTERPRATVNGAIDPRGSAWLSLTASF